MGSRSDRIDTVTAVYHAVDPAHLEEALQSLVDQTHRPAHCIVVADGPLTDELDSVLSRFADALPLSVVRLPRQVGSGPAKQRGIEFAQSPLVAIADADDVSLPDRLDKQLDLMWSSGADLVGAAMEEFDAVSGAVLGIRAFPTGHMDVAALLRTTNPINHPTVCVRRSAVLEAGGYVDLPYLEDYDLWARMVARGAVVGNHPEVLVRFRGGFATLTRRRAKGVTTSEWQLQRNLVSYGIISRTRAMWNMACRTAFRLLPSWLMRMAYRRIFLSPGSVS